MKRSRLGWIVSVWALAVVGGYAWDDAEWASLERYQASITAERFSHLVKHVFAPNGGLEKYILYRADRVDFLGDTNRTDAPLFSLRWAAQDAVPRSNAGEVFKDENALRALANPPDKPLRGVCIVLDPGHIGGAWARMEDRFFTGDGHGLPVQEGAVNLLVAQRLQPLLEKAGACVVLTREKCAPVTRQRPEDFQVEAEGMEPCFDGGLLEQADRADRVRRRREWLFYRRAEIQARAEKINTEWKPDLVVALHFNALPLAAGESFTPQHEVVVFVHGNYWPEELKTSEMRFRLVKKLLSGAHTIEYPLAEAVGRAMADAMGTPPHGRWVVPRNLAAGRLYDAPVLYVEGPYMNNRHVFRRLQAGDYDGERVLEGQKCRSIYREYAQAVADGIVSVYAKWTVTDLCDER